MADTIKPQLTSLSFLGVIDVTKGEIKVPFVVGATDVYSGVDRVSILLDRSYQGPSGLTSTIRIYDDNDPFADGTSTDWIFFEPNTGAGAYNIVSVIVYDRENNSTVYSAQQLTTMGLPTSFTVVSNTGADLTKPVLTDITFPPLIDLTGGERSIPFRVGATDASSGVDRVTLLLDHSIQTGSGSVSSLTFRGDLDTFADGQSVENIYFETTTTTGTYNITGAVVYDKVGNSAVYTAQQLAALGFSTSFTVMNNNAADHIKPQLTSLSFPGTIDVTGGDKSVTFTAGATDLGVGVDKVSITLSRAYQGAGAATSVITIDGLADTFADGSSSQSILFKAATEAGVYTLQSVTVYDKTGNFSTYTTQQLTALGVSTSFTVAGAPPPDITPPQLTGLAFPGSLSIGAADVTASFLASATDQGSGVDRVTIQLDKTFQGASGATDTINITGATDSFADGISILSQVFKTGTAAGTYTVKSVSVYDKAGNVRTYDTQQLTALGSAATSFTIATTTPADTSKPQLTGLTLPGAINIAGADVSAMFSATATDTGSGVDRVAIQLDKTYQGASGATDWIYLNGTIDTFADGTSSQASLFKSTTAAGTYGIKSVEVYDKAGNVTTYSTSQLSALGVATSFTVTATSTPTPADTSKPQLTGLSLPGAINITGADASATFSATATDTGSGVDRVLIQLDTAYQGATGYTDWVYLDGAADTFADGASSQAFVFKSSTQAGTYGIKQVLVYDKAGNVASYGAGQLAALGMRTSFSVTNTAPADKTEPLLTGLIVPSTVNIGTSDAIAIFSVKATDTGTGPDRVAIQLNRTYQGGAGPTDWIYFDDGLDSFDDGLSSATVRFKLGTATGTYGIKQVLVYDKAGNLSTYSPSMLSLFGFPTSFNVVNGDTSKPVLKGMSFPSTISAAGNDVTATFSVTATDIGTGVDRVAIELDRTYLGASGATSWIYLDGVTDTFADGASSVATLFKSGTASGVYNIKSVVVYDKVGNFSTYGATEVGALGLPTSFTVPAAGLGFAADNPARVDEGDVVTVTLSLPAAGSYSIRLDISATLPGGAVVQSQRTVTFSTTGKIYAFDLELPQDAAVGDGALKIVLSRTDGGALDASRSVYNAVIVNDDNSAFTIDTGSIGSAYSNIARVAAPLGLEFDYKFLGQNTARADVQALATYVSKTTSVAISAYQFFTGKTPSAAGLDYLVNPDKNGASLNSAYYTNFNGENRFINFASNLGLHGEGKQPFAQKYGALSFHDALVLAYQEIIGVVRADAIASIEGSLPYFQQIARERMSDSNQDLATKTAAIGYLLQEAIRANVGVYARAIENFYLDLADGSAQHNVDLIGVYGPGTFVDGAL